MLIESEFNISRGLVIMKTNKLIYAFISVMLCLALGISGISAFASENEITDYSSADKQIAEDIEKYHIRFDTNVKIAEDAMFNLDVMRNAESVTMTDVAIGYYRISGSSVMHRFTPEIDHINTQTIKGFKTRVGRLIDTDKEYGIAYMGLVAECLFRALKLKYLHSDYSGNYATKKKEITEWLYSDIVQQGLKPEYTQWLPRGKKEMMECVLKHKMRRTFLVGRISILYLKLRKQI